MAVTATPAPKADAILSSCAVCGRHHVLVPGPDAGEARCACGGELVPTSLPPGIYEIRQLRELGLTRRGQAQRTPSAQDRSGSGDAGRAPALPEPPLHEADLGYGESHGYGPAHGGPTGPGDAPATDTGAEGSGEPEGGHHTEGS